jgi:hypothetical protein
MPLSQAAVDDPVDGACGEAFVPQPTLKVDEVLRREFVEPDTAEDWNDMSAHVRLAVELPLVRDSPSGSLGR